MNKFKNIVCMLVFLALSAGCVGCQDSDRGGLLLSGEEEDLSENGQDCAQEGSFGEQQRIKDAKEDTLIYVQVSGAVKTPGVYALPKGSRIFQALELAGGITKEADVKNLNQAQLLSDGEMVCVLTCEEAAAEGVLAQSGREDDGKVNLNTAAKEELMQLPGIGEAKAESILSWRQEHGSFAQIEDLMKIEGIKEGVFSKIKDCVKVQ